MPAHERKCEFVVIEIVAVGIHAIVAGQAVAAPTRFVRRGERRVHLTVTVRADGRIERGDVIGMAIATDKRLTRDLELVAEQ